MITVGYWDQDYPEKRNITYSEKGQKELKYVPIYRKKSVFINSYAKSNLPNAGLAEGIRRFYYRLPQSTQCDIVHCYNGICDTQIPWFASFEDLMPRGIPDNGRCSTKLWWSYMMSLLTRKSCKRLFALSEWAYRLTERQLYERSGHEYHELISKLKVLHPPQRLNITREELEAKFSNVENRLELMFVGAGFFYKGGKEMIEALARVVKDYPIHLTIISTFYRHPVIDPSYTDAEYRSCMDTIRRNKSWITIFGSMSNSQVLKKMKKAHVGLLPSYSDTYGFSCLEFQASGCPVITTNIRAFPEINNSECGWISEIGSGNGKEQREQNREQLGRILEDIVNNPLQLAQKARASAARIQKCHDPQGHAAFLLEEYRRALR